MMFSRGSGPGLRADLSNDKAFSCPLKLDDPRNTDNAWMETCVTLFHDETGNLTKDFQLEAGDDATNVKWIKIDLNNPNFKLYASHRDFVSLAKEYLENKYNKVF